MAEIERERDREEIRFVGVWKKMEAERERNVDLEGLRLFFFFFLGVFRSEERSGANVGPNYVCVFRSNGYDSTVVLGLTY